MKLKSRLIIQNICILSGTLLITVCLSLLFTVIYSDIKNESVLPSARNVYSIVIENSDVIANNSPLTDIEIRSALMELETGNAVYSDGNATFTLSLFSSSDGRMVDILTLVPIIGYKDFYLALAAFITITFIITFIIAEMIALRYNTANIINPIAELKKKTDLLAEGDLSSEIDGSGIAEIKLLCDSVETLRIKLKESLYYNKKADENRRFLISGISHDLRTPITAAGGYIEGILDNVASTDEKRAEYLQKALMRLNQVNELINDLLLYSKLDLGQLPFEFKTVDICSFIRLAAEDNSFDLSKPIPVVCDFDRRYVRLDCEQLRRVIQNITDNAKKHSDGNIVIYLRENTSSVIIEIADSGGGVSPNALPHIFEKFYRGDNSRKADGSSGLGLAIAKLIIEGHGGHIWAVNNSFGGLSVMISLKKENTKLQEG